jgi:hypothetical protein
MNKVLTAGDTGMFGQESRKYEVSLLKKCFLFHFLLSVVIGI